MTIDSAFLLAAGRGERMRPLTDHRAKPALPVLGMPMLARIARGLAAQGVRWFGANAHHAAESVAGALHSVAPDAEIFVEPALMGSGGAFDAPRGRLLERMSAPGAGAVVIHNGDTLIDAPLAALAAAAADPVGSEGPGRSPGPGRIGALLVRRGATPGYGGLLLAPDGTVVGRFAPGQRPEEALSGMPAGTTGLGRAAEPATFVGIGVIRRAFLDAVPAGRPSELFPDVVLPLLRAGATLGAVVTDAPWTEFTSPADYLKHLARLCRRGRERGSVALPGGDAPVFAHRNASVFLGPGARVETGALLEGAIVLEAGAVARRGALLRNVVMLEGAEAEWGARLENVILDAGSVAGHGSSYHDGVLTRTENGEHDFRAFAG